MKLVAVPWLWNGIEGDRQRAFSKTVTNLLASRHGVHLTEAASGRQYQKGSGTSQPHMPNVKLTSIDVVAAGDVDAEADGGPDTPSPFAPLQPQSPGAAGTDEAGPSGTSPPELDEQPAASDPVSNKRPADAAAEGKKKKAKKAPRKASCTPDDDLLVED